MRSLKNTENGNKQNALYEKSVPAKTVCGRDLLQYRLGVGEQTVLFLAGFSADAAQNTAILFAFMKRLRDSVRYKRALRGVRLLPLLRERQLLFLPCLNPDGMEIAKNGAVAAGTYQQLVTRAKHAVPLPWLANARGVELQRNFPAEGERHALLQKLGAPQGYGGQTPCSEVETQTVCRLCEQTQIRHVVLLEGIGGYVEKLPPTEAPWQEQMPMALKILADSARYPLLESLPTAGSFAPWFIKTYRRPILSLAPMQTDLQNEKNFSAVYQRIEEALLLASIL